MDIYMVAYQMRDGSYETSRICFDNLEKALNYLARVQSLLPGLPYKDSKVKRILIVNLTSANLVDAVDILHGS